MYGVLKNIYIEKHNLPLRVRNVNQFYDCGETG